MNRFAYSVFILAPLLALAACGFQLRGTIGTTGFQRIGLNGPAASLVTDELRNQLELSGVTTTAADPRYRLDIGAERFDRSIVSVSAATGKAEEYRIELSLTFSARNAKGDFLLTDETISLSREYLYDETAVLSEDNEEALIREDLAGQAAIRIIRRLEAAIRRR